MKIAQVVSTYPPYRGGMGTVAHEYTERLRARGHDVHVFTPRYRPVDNDPKYVHRVPSPIHIGNAGVVPSLFRRLSGFDIVHLHYPFFGGAEPVIVRKAVRPDQRLVITYHMDPVARGFRGAVFEAHRRVLFPWIISRADKILISSKDYAAHCAVAEIPGMLERVEIHPFGVDLQRFHPGVDLDVRSSFGIPEGVPTLLFVGGLDPAHHFKGLPILLAALGRLGKFPWHCLIVGEGSLRATFEANVPESIRARVHFVGNVSDMDLPGYYRASDIHCFPSTERAESFGLVALEAAASGIPTIASDLPGVRSAVLNSETGLLVKPGDADDLARAIESLCLEPDLRLRFGASARKRAEVEFAWEPLTTTLIETYEHMRHL